MASLRVAIEGLPRTRFDVMVFDATGSVLDTSEKLELSSAVLQQPSAGAMSNKNPG
jgi:hypothetical protein